MEGRTPTRANKNDVILGKQGCGRHHGNQKWTQLVKDNLDDYNNAENKDKRKEKWFIIALTVLAIQDDGGRFLELGSNGDYFEMSNDDAMDKTRNCYIRLKSELQKKNESTTTIDVLSSPHQAFSNAEISVGVATGKAPPTQLSEVSRALYTVSENHYKAEEATTTEILDADIGMLAEILSDTVSLQDSNKKSAFSTIGTALSDGNLKFDQQQYIDKIETRIGMEWKDNRTYTGSVLNGRIPHGRGIMYYSSGRTVSGDWKQGALHGQATVFYEDKGSYFGTFLKNKRVGYGVRTYPADSDYKDYAGQWFKDKPNGKGILTYKDGTSLKGDFKDGQPHGLVTKTSVEGETKMTVTGRYQNGELVEICNIAIKNRGGGYFSGPSNFKKVKIEPFTNKP